MTPWQAQSKHFLYAVSVGALCMIDFEARDPFTPDEMRKFREYAMMITKEINRRDASQRAFGYESVTEATSGDEHSD